MRPLRETVFAAWQLHGKHTDSPWQSFGPNPKCRRAPSSVGETEQA